ncbi:upstream stimulatory factor 2 isoform X1 [Onthophagus taurus]|uniref:upstream stimulatory factor 2 isoform X1 n=1 Tax=Onthophagus taurus TaxID=166361 RepID=UPI000C20261E|nr:upstream stimulatory factor 2 isoform X1 [Onthophagus taurus]
MLCNMANLQATDNGEAKVIINDGLSIVDDQSMESDDEQRVVDHLSPQTLLETPPDDVQYSFHRSPEGTITYGVLKVEDTVDNVSQIVTTGTNFTSPGSVQQVLTSNINGQLYVIGSSNDVFVSQTGTRAIAPRSTIVEGTPTVSTASKKRDERRRATHNEVERRRRDKINNWIVKLSKIIPENNQAEMKGNGYYDGQSKGGILAKACEYIMELKDSQQYLEDSLKQVRQHEQTIDSLKLRNNALESENSELRELLKRHGIDISTVELS